MDFGGSGTVTKKILVLEDEDNIRSFIVINLKRGGYDTVEFSSGEKAVEYMYTHDDVAVAILDVMLPDIDGYEFCAILKRDPYTKDIPLIFISAMDSSADKNKGFELGAVDYIAKPFERAEVEKRINTHLKLYTLQRDLEENNKRLSLVVTKQMEKLRIEQEKQAALEAERRKKLLEDIAASLQSADSTNVSAGTDGVMEYEYESELD